jgi:hypothetical protein
MFICTACCIGIAHYACQSIAYPEYFTQESAQVFTIENDRMVSFYTIADIIVQWMGLATFGILRVLGNIPQLFPISRFYFYVKSV